MENSQNLTSNIKVPNHNLDVLKKYFGQCFDKHGNFQMEKFQAELKENEIDFSKESYGIDWLGKSYARLLASDPTTTLLKEDVAFNQQPENKDSNNLLLKGDNLEILKHLSNAYFEKVKMIYIDPPYNTGSDGFVYQDDRKFTVEELTSLAGISEDKASRILEFTMSNSNSHSAWLTFMYPRLYIAKQLLTEDGVIFISIDDNEVAQLRLLMDEIFGEENFVAEFVWKRRTSSALAENLVSQDHESILCYGNINFAGFNGEPKDYKGYLNPDNDPRGPWKADNLTVGMSEDERPNQSYTLVDPKTGKKYPHNPRRVWTYAPDTMDKKIAEGRILFPESENDRPMLKKFKEDLKTEVNPVSTWIKSLKENNDDLIFEMSSGLNTEATKHIQEIFGNKIFQYTKPPSLLRSLIQQATNYDSIILDFFAGSGTTGDAVMQLNADDGGNRRFILGQLPEKINPKSSKVSYDFVKNKLGVEEPTIFEITKERLIRAAKKLQKEKPSETKHQDLGFKIFETMPLWEDYHYKADTLEEDGPELFRGDLLGAEDLEELFITWKTYDGSPLTEQAADYDLGGYCGKYVNNKIYLMQKGFTTDHLVSLLEKVDSDPHFNPRAVIVFEANFQSKNLRELGESLKNFQNKKNLEIDFVMRF